MAAMTELLRQVPYFAELPAGMLRELAGQVWQHRIHTGEVLGLEGERCEGLYFVLSGRVKAFKVSAEGREQVLRVLGPGRTFNDVPIFDGGPNPATFAALKPSAVAFVPKATVLALVDRHPHVAKAVIGVLASRLRALTVMIEDLALRGVVARVAKLLLDCSRGQDTVMEGTGGPCVRITQQDIAAMTGSVRVMVQRARIHVLDPAVLARWAESPPPAP